MTASRHKVLIVGSQRVRDMTLMPSDLNRLSAIEDWEWLHLEGGVEFGPNEDPDAIRQLVERVGDVDCVVVSHGSPLISADVMDAAPSLKIIGLPNTFLSPHIAGMTLTSYRRFFTLMVDELERFFRGEEPLFELTPRSIANRRGSATPQG